jgi:hypothetical protein
MTDKRNTSPESPTTGQAFDLNIEKVLEHWSIPFAIRELIANALDEQMASDTAQLQYAREDGYRIVVVPDDIARSLGGLSDLNGRPIVDLDGYRDGWNASFSFTFIDADAMTPAEVAVFARTREISALVGADLARRRIPVLISETMRLNETGDPVLGLWQGAERRIVIRRDQLAALARYAGTLLHEIGHMTSGTIDGSLEFESELSRLLGVTAAAALGDGR